MGRMSTNYDPDDGPRFPVFICVDGDTVSTELDAGRMVPSPVHWPAEFDTDGTDRIRRRIVTDIGCNRIACCRTGATRRPGRVHLIAPRTF